MGGEHLTHDLVSLSIVIPYYLVFPISMFQTGCDLPPSYGLLTLDSPFPSTIEKKSRPLPQSELQNICNTLLSTIPDVPLYKGHDIFPNPPTPNTDMERPSRHTYFKCMATLYGTSINFTGTTVFWGGDLTKTGCSKSQRS